MTPRKWAILVWGGLLAILIGVCAMYGGRNCEAPQSGPLHRLLKGHKYVRTSSWRSACAEVN